MREVEAGRVHFFVAAALISSRCEWGAGTSYGLFDPPT